MVDQAPLVLAGERVLVTPAEEAGVLEPLELLYCGRVALVLADEDLDGPLVLLAALDELLFFFTLALEHHAGHFEVEHYGHGGGHGEDEQQRGETAAAIRLGAGGLSR